MKNRLKVEDNEGSINISPLIDLVFILLIFFIVAAVFLNEDGIHLSSAPKSLTMNEMDDGPVLLSLDRMGRLFYENEVIKKEMLSSILHKRNVGVSRTVILTVGLGVSSGDALEILDFAYLSGAESVKLTGNQP